MKIDVENLRESFPNLALRQAKKIIDRLGTVNTRFYQDLGLGDAEEGAELAVELVEACCEKRKEVLIQYMRSKIT